MPHPGLVVNKPTFTGQLHLIEKDFKDLLEELVPSLLAPENLETKELNRQKITARDFMHLCNTYVKALGNDEIPKPETIFNATAEANHIVVSSQAKDHYIAGMKKICESQDCFTEVEFKLKHTSVQEESIHLVS